jgi:thiol-disulfide isomerase/thioredoxin
MIMTIKKSKPNQKRLFAAIFLMFIVTFGMIQFAVIQSEEEINVPLKTNDDVVEAYEDALGDWAEIEAQSEFQKRIQIFDDPVTAPDIEFKNILDRDLTLGDFRGQWLVINFWASWCPPCIVEMPTLQALQDHYEGQNLKVIAIALDRNYTADKLRGFMSKHNFGPIAAYYGHWPDIREKYDIPGLPTTYIISPDGKVMARYQGDADWNGAEAKMLIESLMTK